MEYTLAQKAAIETKGNALFVSAAAGSGKTAVLVERVIQRICDKNHPTDIDKMLIVTFTNAAAAELRQRLRQALRKKAQTDPQEPLYKRQLKLIGRAQIGTVHATCKRLVDQYFSLLDVSPGASIGEENEMEILFHSALEEFVEQLYAQRESHPETEELLQFFSSGRTDDALHSALRTAHTFLEGEPFPAIAMEQMLPSVGETLKDCFVGDFLSEYLEKGMNRMISGVKAQRDMCVMMQTADTAIGAYFEEAMVFFDTMLQTYRTGGYQKTYEFLQQHALPSFPRYSAKLYRSYLDANGFAAEMGMSDFEFKEVMDRQRVDWNRHLEFFKKLKEKIFTQSEEAHLQDMRILRHHISLLFDAAMKLQEKYTQKKRERNLLSFADLERYALQLLVTFDAQGNPIKTKAAQEIGAEFEEIIVDEYQDTNLLQDLIFTALSQNGENLFVVGDVKQSIYSFRGARPDLFTEKLDHCAEITEPTVLESSSKLFLNQNFRSHPKVLSAINALFEQIMSRKVGQVEYNHQQKLYPNTLYASDEASHCEFHVILRPDLQDKEADSEFELLKSLEQEAAFVADEIQTLVEKEQIFDAKKGVFRKVEYGDIAIMSRSVQFVTSYFENELARRGIAVNNLNKDDNLLELWEIQMVLSFLKVINNPYQDLPLVTLMYSDFFGFTATELAQIRSAAKQVPFYEAVLAYAKSDAKCQNFIKTLERLRTASVGAHIFEILSRIYSDTGILYKIAYYPDGKVRVANMELLLQYAQEYEKNSYKGLFAFIHHVDRLLERQIRLPAAGGGEEASAVQIMSVHKSKGLEFPICFLVNTGRDMMGKRGRKPLVFTDVGCGCKIRDSAHFAVYEPLMMVLAKQREMQMELSEEMRLLYVALTRAKVKLYAVAALTSDEVEYTLRLASMLPDDEPVDPTLLQENTSLYRWLIFGWRHQKGILPLYQSYGLMAPEVQEEDVLFKLHEPHVVEKTSLGKEQITAEKEVVEQVMQLVRQKYEWEEEMTIPSKMSVSEVKGFREADPTAQPLIVSKVGTKKPKFLSSSADAREMGNAVHKFMQFSDFETLAQAGGVEKEKQRLLAEDFFSQQEMERVDFSIVSRFVANPIFAQLLDADQLVREQRFMFALPAHQLLQGVKSSKEVLLQGVLDCMYCKDGQWTILDYKTDRLKNEEEFLERYELQLALYAVAAEQQWNIKIDRLLIYSFHLNRIIEIDVKKTLAF